MRQHLLRDAAEKEALQSPAPVRGHEDDVALAPAPWKPVTRAPISFASATPALMAFAERREPSVGIRTCLSMDSPEKKRIACF
jgi:hypothetical protein